MCPHPAMMQGKHSRHHLNFTSSTKPITLSNLRKEQMLPNRTTFFRLTGGDGKQKYIDNCHRVGEIQEPQQLKSTWDLELNLDLKLAGKHLVK